MNKNKQIDILAIGDIAIDVFIKILDAEARCDLEGEHCRLCFSYGGKIPYESSEICYAVGNSPNIAVGASRLGLNSAILTNVGDDQNGRDCIEALKKEKVGTSFVKIEQEKPTNYHYVLWYGVERTILVKHEKYEYEWAKTEQGEEYTPPSWIYLSSLSEESLSFHHKIIEYLERHPEVKLAFQPGTFQVKLGVETLSAIYRKTEVFFCNHEEAQRILKTEEKDIPKLTKMIYALGPKIVIITDGVRGSYTYDGNDVLFMKAYYRSAIESTGAGDAFSGAFISALAWHKDIPEALMWGILNASSVVSRIGPHKGLLTKDEIEEQVKKIQAEYKPIKVA